MLRSCNSKEFTSVTSFLRTRQWTANRRTEGDRILGRSLIYIGNKKGPIKIYCRANDVTRESREEQLVA